MEKSTKQRIVDAALELFSEQGYDAVGVDQIAGAVGIKAPSLYKHYKGKQDIFYAILKEMEDRYLTQVSAMQMSGLEASEDTELFAGISEERLLAMGKELFLFFLHDTYTSRFRKMLTIEQYHNRALAALYTERYADDPLAYQGMLFEMLLTGGAFRKEDPQIMALHFYAPLYLLLTVCDRQPEREVQSLMTLERHIKQFNRLYRNGVKP